MKKLFALITTSVLFAGLSAGVTARGSAEQGVHFKADTDKTPVVQVYNLTDEQVLLLVEAHDQYKRETREDFANSNEFSIDDVLGLIAQ